MASAAGTLVSMGWRMVRVAAVEISLLAWRSGKSLQTSMWLVGYTLDRESVLQDDEPHSRLVWSDLSCSCEECRQELHHMN